MNNTGELSILDLLSKAKYAYIYFKSKWIFIVLIAILCGGMGLYYSIVKKTRYIGICTFVLEDAKSGGLSQYAGLAAMAGINIGGSGGGVFEGDNIIELYKSRSMIETALLSTCDFNNKKQLLIERYIDFNQLRDFKNPKNKLNHIQFNGDPDKFNRDQDSIITDLAGFINEKILSVTKPDKKLSIIRVMVTTKDELFSKYFTESLVQTVNDFYIRTKTKKSYQSVKLLQHQVDSVREILNSSITGVASAMDADPNANPYMLTLKVKSQKKQVDVQANTAIYGEMIKNLEISKVSLRQETPLIQIIDKPILPLIKSKPGAMICIVMGGIIGIILAVVALSLLLAVKKYKKVFKAI